MSEARFTVVGAGAIGMLFAAKLGLSGRAVEVCVRRPSQQEELLLSGIRLRSWISGHASHAAEDQAKDKTFFPDVRLLEEPLSEETVGSGFHYILLAVKQSALTPAFVRQVHERMGPDSWVVCLQNGIGHIEALSAVIPAERIFVAVTTEGAMKTSDSDSVHTGQGVTWIGALEEEHAKAGAEAQKKLEELLNLAGFRTFLSKNITRRVWQKLVINSVINPLTAILQVRNGELLVQPQALELMKALYDEAAALAVRLGLAPEQDVWNQLLEVCRNTAGNRSSMLQDLHSGRPTEIDSITGGILREAEKVRMPVPTHQTVYRLIKAMEGIVSVKGRT